MALNITPRDPSFPLYTGERNGKMVIVDSRYDIFEDTKTCQVYCMYRQSPVKTPDIKTLK